MLEKSHINIFDKYGVGTKYHSFLDDEDIYILRLYAYDEISIKICTLCVLHLHVYK